MAEIKSSEFLEICIREETQQSKLESTVAHNTLGCWRGSLSPVKSIAMVVKATTYYTPTVYWVLYICYFPSSYRMIPMAQMRN